MIYIGLALLIGVGLVGFGVGGGFGGGGIVSSLNSHEGSGGVSYSSQISAYRKKLKPNPNDAKTWEQLTKTLRPAGGRGILQNHRRGADAGGQEDLRRSRAKPGTTTPP